MNKDDQTYIADEATPQEDVERYKQAVEEADRLRVEDSRPKPKLSIADVRRALGIDERYPDSRPSELPRLHRALRRRRAKNAVAKQSRKANR